MNYKNIKQVDLYPEDINDKTCYYDDVKDKQVYITIHLSRQDYRERMNVIEAEKVLKEHGAKSVHVSYDIRHGAEINRG